MTNNEAIKWLNNLMSDLGNPHYECLWPYAQAIYEICELLKEQPDVVRCKDCKYWGKKSGLSARKCSRQGIITGQFDFCSYGRAVKQNDSN